MVKNVLGLVVFNADYGKELCEVGLRVKLPELFALPRVLVVPRALLNVSLELRLHGGLGGGAARKRVSRMKRLGHKRSKEGEEELP